MPNPILNRRLLSHKNINVTNYIVATGGTITRNGNWLVHTFTNNGTFTIINYPIGATLWVVLNGGGGGGAGWFYGGAGGAGGFISRANYLPSNGAASYSIGVGLGGNGGLNVFNSPGSSGQDSSFDLLTAAGGGPGQGYGNPFNSTGGSGGSNYGGSTGNIPAVSPPQGYAGATGGFVSGNYYQGSGGGAWGAGNLAFITGALGGLGATSYIFDFNTPYVFSTGGKGTVQGGGNGLNGVNYGDGGQGAGTLGGIGGNGKQGVVVIAYYSPISTPQTIGNLLSFTYSSSDYTLYNTGGNVTASYTSNSIQLTGNPNLATYPVSGNFLYQNTYYGDSSNFTFSGSMTVNSLNVSDVGGGISVYSHIYPSLILRVGTGVNTGVVNLYLGETLLTTIGTLTSLNVGDTLALSITINANSVSCTCVGSSTVSGSYVFTFTDPFPGQKSFISPLFSFALNTSGGDYTWSNLQVTTSDKKEADLMISGDSRIYGLYCGGTNPSARVSGIWKSNNSSKTIYNNSGCAETTSNYISKLPEITNYRPRRNIILLIVNDVAGGVPVPTIVSNLYSIWKQMEAYGIAMYIQISPTCPAVNQSAANTAVAAYFPDYIIPEPPTWNVSVDITPDNVHWSNGAQIKIQANQSNYIKL